MKYRTKYVGGPFDGQYFETDNIEDFGTTWSCSDYVQDEQVRVSYFHWATRTDPTLDSVWKSVEQERAEMEEWLAFMDKQDAKYIDEHVERLLDEQGN
jgi:hypothetical protein